MLVLVLPLLVNYLHISVPNDYATIVFVALIIYVGAVFIVINKFITIFYDWYLKKYCGYLGHVCYRKKGDQLIIVKDNNSKSYLLEGSSCLKSNRVAKNFNITIFINQNNSINLCNYFGGDVFFPERMGSRIKVGKLRVYSVDDLLAQFLNLNLIKDYDDTIDN